MQTVPASQFQLVAGFYIVTCPCGVRLKESTKFVRAKQLFWHCVVVELCEGDLPTLENS